MKKCSKALKERVIGYTNVLFNDCIVEVFNLDRDDTYAIDHATTAVRAINKGFQFQDDPDELQDLLDKRDKVGTLYQDKIKTLSTKQLNEILKAHELVGGLRRAPKTIETIVSELARRTIFDDSEESDHTDDDGDVDGLKRTSTKHSKKTTSKRRKTSKGRRRDRTN